jgi:hypothetical protein
VDPNRALLRKLAEGIVTGAITSGRQAMEAFGIKAKFGIVTRWATGLPPENAASTIKAKGSSTPGIDSGETRKAVDYKVYDR